MNILQIKQSHKLVVLTFFFVIFYSCVDKAVPIKSILNGIRIITPHEYYYNESAFYIVNNDTFFIRFKSEYDNSKSISRLILYMPEGCLEYNKIDILSDPNLLSYTNNNQTLKWKYINDNIISNTLDTIYVNSIKKQDGTEILLYEREQNVIIFELSK